MSKRYFRRGQGPKSPPNEALLPADGEQAPGGPASIIGSAEKIPGQPACEIQEKGEAAGPMAIDRQRETGIDDPIEAANIPADQIGRARNGLAPTGEEAGGISEAIEEDIPGIGQQIPIAIDPAAGR